MNEITNEHKHLIESVRACCHHALSSHAFPSLYLWQNSMGLSVLCEDDFFAVKSTQKPGNFYFYPCGNDEKTEKFIRSQMTDKTFSMGYLRECDKQWLEEHFPDMWDFRRVEDADEYICDISEYIALSGSKFSEIRRKIKKIDREHEISVKIITEQTLPDAMAVLEDWYRYEHSEGANHLSDDSVAETALSNMAFLDISGIVLYCDAIPAAVFAGFPLSSDTVDVLIGKTTADAPKGIVYYGLHAYLKTCADTYTYCNHEEDLGIPGIRQVKQSLCPIFKNEIWEAALK